MPLRHMDVACAMDFSARASYEPPEENGPLEALKDRFQFHYHIGRAQDRASIVEKATGPILPYTLVVRAPGQEDRIIKMLDR